MGANEVYTVEYSRERIFNFYNIPRRFGGQDELSKFLDLVSSPKLGLMDGISIS